MIDGLLIRVRLARMSASVVRVMTVARAVAAKLGIKTHAHILRHACGYKLANDGHDTRPKANRKPSRNIAYRPPCSRLAQVCSLQSPERVEPMQATAGALRLASSLVSSLAADRRPGYPRVNIIQLPLRQT
jgi:hypothetical protein